MFDQRKEALAKSNGNWVIFSLAARRQLSYQEITGGDHPAGNLENEMINLNLRFKWKRIRLILKIRF